MLLSLHHPQVGQEQFLANWRSFTMGQLESLNWDGVLVAGGAILACATTQPQPARRYVVHTVVNRLLRKLPPEQKALVCNIVLEQAPEFLALHVPDSASVLSDIDVYLYGMNEAQARAKCDEIGAVLRRNAEARGGTVYATHTPCAVTFFSAYPFRTVQVICATYDCAAQVFGLRPLRARRLFTYPYSCRALCCAGHAGLRPGLLRGVL
jgi:hypothetical protein